VGGFAPVAQPGNPFAAFRPGGANFVGPVPGNRQAGPQVGGDPRFAPDPRFAQGQGLPKEALQAINDFARAAASFGNMQKAAESFGNFAGTFDKAVQAFGQQVETFAKAKPEVTVGGKPQVEVVVNGLEAFRQMEPAFKELVDKAVGEGVARAVKREMERFGG
jgi:hypothetical protein